MSLIQNDIVEDAKKEAEDENTDEEVCEELDEECEFCEGQGWYWLGHHDNMWKEKCECIKDQERDLEFETMRDNEI